MWLIKACAIPICTSLTSHSELYLTSEPPEEVGEHSAELSPVILQMRGLKKNQELHSSANAAPSNPEPKQLLLHNLASKPENPGGNA